MAQAEELSKIPYTLRSVYLRSGQQSISESFDPLLPDQQLIGKFRVAEQRFTCQEATAVIPGAETIRSCVFVTRFEFRYLSPSATESLQTENETENEAEDESHVIAEISANIAVDYLINTPEMPVPADLEKWGANNALLHAWPYWREFCHSTMLRMNLPVTMMPMISIGQKPAD